MKIISLAALISILVASTGFAHSDDQYTRAESLTQSGDIAGMAAAYRQILDVDSADTKARLGYATALSWQGHCQSSEKQFSKVLKQQPDNLEALSGLGYNYAWSNQFDSPSNSLNKR